VASSMSSVTEADKTAAPHAAVDTAELFAGAMPKAEIGAVEFLKAHPEYDGRNVVVAIFDTGVDPGAAGLQTTPDGRPKIVDLLDGTGSGDVDMSEVVEADATGTLAARCWGDDVKVQINQDWKNPSGKWHVGSKAAFDLFPNQLKERIRNERQKRFSEQQRVAHTAATAAAADAPGGKSTEDKKRAEELQARPKLLQDMADKHKDFGPMLHCVVWHDGDVWRAAVDTSDMYEEADDIRGRLRDFAPLTDFHREHQYGTFSAEDALNFGVNIYDEGKVLSIVVDAGSHGTHVAGITAAYHPDRPECNGVAPGAQIISCKIGDSRLGGMETMPGLARAIAAVISHKADLINMSYGEATATPDQGHFNKLAWEVVHRQGTIFISSAGNSGPALTTAGAPGGTSSAIISIGAYVSPDMAAAAHSLRAGEGAGRNYNWSSRGPSADGAMGVSLSAPGAAIAVVPQWTTAARQLMNGTSMASPCACGGVALVLSGLKAEGQTITPNRVRRALENTAKPVGDGPDAKLTYGNGLLQVDKAFEYLQQSAEVDAIDIRYAAHVRRTDGSYTGRGIYMREPLDSAQRRTFQAQLQPRFQEEADVKEEQVAQEDRIAISTSQAWISAPASLLLAANGRNFEISVDPTALPEGLHYGEVVGHDATATWRGPLFRVPVTVVKPIEVGTQGVGGPNGNSIAQLGTQQYSPGQETRHFIAVPEGATWARLRTTAGDFDTPKMFMLRATQLLPQTRHSTLGKTATATLSANARHHMTFKVAGGGTLEVTTAQFWTQLGQGTLEQAVEFHGLTCDPSAAFIAGSSGNVKVQLRAPFRSEYVKPSAKLEALIIPLRPISSKLAPLEGPRDQLPRGHTPHGLTLTYKLKLEEAGKIIPRLPMLNGYCYDGEMEAQMVQVFDSNKALLGVCDIYPSPIDVPAGDITLRLFLRHENTSLLKKFQHLPLEVKKKIEGIVVPVHGSNSDSVNGKKLGKEIMLAAGERVAIFVGPAPIDKLPKDATAGRVLEGAIALSKSTGSEEGASRGSGPGNAYDANGNTPATIPLRWLIAPKKEKHVGDNGDNGDGAEEEPKLSPAEKASTKIRDTKLSILKGLKSDNKKEAALYEELRKELVTQHPDHLPLLSEALTRRQKAAEKTVKLRKKADGGGLAETELDTSGESSNGDDTDDAAEEGTVGEEEKAAKVDQEKAQEDKPPPSPEEVEADLQAVISAADDVIAAINTDELAKFLAQKCPEEGPDASKRKKDFEEQKDALVSALSAKVAALMDLEDFRKAPPATAPAREGDQVQDDSDKAGDTEAKAEKAPSAQEDVVEAAFRELRKWVDTAGNKKQASLHARRERRSGRPASALRTLDKAWPEGEVKTAEAVRLRAEVLQELGWSHWARVERSALARNFPPSYPLL